MGRRTEQRTGSAGRLRKNRRFVETWNRSGGAVGVSRRVAEFFGAGGLKYLRGLPIALLSKDNGGWQPVNANGQKVKALKNITLGKDAVKQTPREG
jgi:hypothetical protein